MSWKNIAPIQAFGNGKLVDNRFLNQLGIQVVRTYAARCVYNIRSITTPSNLSECMTVLASDGLLVMENFLDANSFDKLREECVSLLAFDTNRLTRKSHGPTQYEIAVVNNYQDIELPRIDLFFSDPRFSQIMSFAEKRVLDFRKLHRGVERIIQGEYGVEGDPENKLHSDIFYNTHKAWLYLDDVTPENAPLVYVKGSHRLSKSQASAIYRHSLNPVTPSRRIELEELEARGLKETSLACPKNTLVIANVCGYHRRSIGVPGAERIALHCSVRSQPFALWKNN